jgi:hypothetical protein
LDARRFWRRERMATRFDSRNVAWQCAKENRLKGGNLHKVSLAIGKGTLQQLVQCSCKPRGTTEELGQLTSLAGGSPTFRYHA